MQPPFEAVGLAQARQVAPGLDVSVLDRVAGELMVPQDQASDGFQLGDRRADKRAERVVVPPACSLDKIPLVHGRPRRVHLAAL